MLQRGLRRSGSGEGREGSENWDERLYELVRVDWVDVEI